MGIFDHSFKSAFVRSNTDVRQEGLAFSLHSKAYFLSSKFKELGRGKKKKISHSATRFPQGQVLKNLQLIANGLQKDLVAAGIEIYLALYSITIQY